MKIEIGEANPDHSPTTEDTTARVTMIHIDATLDCNTGIDAVTTEVPMMIMLSPQRTQPQNSP